MPDYNSSADEYLAKATKANAKQAQNGRIAAFTEARAAGLKVPDLNPADAAVLRLRKHAEAFRKYKEDKKTGSERTAVTDDLDSRVARLENLLQLTLDSLNAATIECVGGDVVLTFPDLPT